VVVDAIGRGNGPTNWSWLWSQQNEHRIVVPRLLIWVDLFAFGGKNISLLAEIIIIQLAQVFAVSFVLERFTSVPAFLKRSLQGLFAFALFHPNQLENFTWSFQIGFVLPFALGTFALLCIAFLPRSSQLSLGIALLGVIPLLAAMNLAAGLLIGPATIVIACLRRLRLSLLMTLTAASVVSWCVYLHGYRRDGADLSLTDDLGHGKNLIVYVLTYFGASWTGLLPHKERLIATISIIVFLALAAKAMRRSREISNFEWFLIGECILALATALLTATGRLQFGVGQAFASRYQTPAMIYWAAFGGLILLWFTDTGRLTLL